MHNIFASSSSGASPIYRAELGIKDIDSFLEESQRSQRKLQPVTRLELENIRGDIIEIGQPALVCDLKLARLSNKAPVSPELEALCHNYDFGLIELPFTFLPSEGRRFVSVRLEVSFKKITQVEQTLVYDIYPKEVEEQRDNQSVIVGSNFRFNEGQVDSPLRHLVTIQGLRLEPRTYGAGVRSNRAIWTFEATPQRGVQGWRPLYCIVQKSLNIQVLHLHFLVAAELKMVGGILPLSVKRILQGQDNYTLFWSSPPLPLSSLSNVNHQLSGQNDVAEESSMAARTKVFISYSHADKEFFEELKKHLDSLSRSGRIDVWDDTKISPGQQWHEEMAQAIESARVAILLISPSFFSPSIIEHQLSPLLALAKEKGTVILPVIVKPVLLEGTVEGTVLARLYPINDTSNPLSGMTPTKRAEVWVKVAQRLLTI